MSYQFAEKLRVEIEHILFHEVGIVTCGVAICRWRGHGPIYGSADDPLYCAKSNGRNQVVNASQAAIVV